MTIIGRVIEAVIGWRCSGQDDGGRGGGGGGGGKIFQVGCYHFDLWFDIDQHHVDGACFFDITCGVAHLQQEQEEQEEREDPPSRVGS